MCAKRAGKWSTALLSNIFAICSAKCLRNAEGSQLLAHMHQCLELFAMQIFAAGSGELGKTLGIGLSVAFLNY